MPLDVDALLRDLNPPQRDAVTAGEGPLLVLAGAGSGKTRVIAYRIAHLLGARGVDPRNLLAVTFTNKAAEEMARRVEALLAPVGIRAPLIATFHSACVRMLRQHIKHLGYPSHFTIYDEDDRLSLVKQLMRDERVEERSLTPSAVAHRISYFKNHMLGVGEVESEARGSREQTIARVYRRYQERLGATSALDFDDLLLFTVRLLDEVPEVLHWYRGRWRHLLVDEYQDTNRAQYRIVRALTAEHRNVCCVGDPDQSVYRFRGADLRNILDFERDYAGTRVIRLEQNYRSTKRILSLAAGVIAHNERRKEKTLWTENDDGEPAGLYRAWDEHEEAHWVAQTLVGLRGRGLTYQDVALFYRTNAQSRVLEDALRRAGIPYLIVGGVRFYERKEVKDALAYLRLLVNPRDDVAFRRAIHVPARGIGPASLARLEQAATRAGSSLLAAAEAPPADVTGKMRQTLIDFAALVARLAAVRSSMTLPALVDRVLEESGYRAELKQDRSPEAMARLENLEEFIAAAEDHERREGTSSLESFLDGVALVSDVDELEAGRGVTLMTLHSAKGLEFRVVFLTGLEEGVFPHLRAMASSEEIEEERRLCYVGVTRAREQLFLSYALHRRLHGYGLGEPSRFLREMPQDELTFLNTPRGVAEDGHGGSGYGGRGSGGFGRAVTPSSGWSEREGDGGSASDEDYPLKVGAKVRHARWGEGFVVGLERDGSDTIVTVRFASVGRKRLSLEYAKLEEL
jgi:DNA helicase II / ATP-dependent DNA helicase PcrA